MRRQLFLLIALFFLLSSAQGQGGVSYQQIDSLTICRLLDEAHSQPRTTNFPLFFAKQFIGIPYVAHTLEINDDERLVVNTRQLDCTTLVETAQIDDYTSRIHYFTEWITLNSEAGIVTEIQAPNPPFSAIQQVNVNYMSSHPESYKALRAHPEYVPAIRQMEQTITGQRFRYIPKQAVKNNALLRQAINDGDIIAITCKKPGLDIAHLGFAVWQADGLHLLNASMLHKKVVEEPMTLYQYLQQHSTHTGIRIIRILK